MPEAPSLDRPGWIYSGRSVGRYGRGVRHSARVGWPTRGIKNPTACANILALPGCPPFPVTATFNLQLQCSSRQPQSISRRSCTCRPFTSRDQLHHKSDILSPTKVSPSNGGPVLSHHADVVPVQQDLLELGVVARVIAAAGSANNHGAGAGNCGGY